MTCKTTYQLGKQGFPAHTTEWLHSSWNTSDQTSSVLAEQTYADKGSILTCGTIQERMRARDVHPLYTELVLYNTSSVNEKCYIFKIISGTHLLSYGTCMYSWKQKCVMFCHWLFLIFGILLTKLFGVGIWHDWWTPMDTLDDIWQLVMM